MFFISKSPGFIHVAIPDEEQMDARGKMHQTDPGVTCQFKRFGLPQWAEAFALEQLTFRGLPEGVDPLLYVSTYDTDEEAFLHKWSKERKQQVEASLLKWSGPETCLVLEIPKTPAPFKSYDKQRFPEKALEILLASGADLEQAIRYERENRNRDKWLAVFEAALASEDSEAGEVVAA